jgi:hypothetical protein
MDIAEGGARPRPQEHLFQCMAGCIRQGDGEECSKQNGNGTLFFFQDQDQEKRKEDKERMGRDKRHEPVKERILQIPVYEKKERNVYLRQAHAERP